MQPRKVTESFAGKQSIVIATNADLLWDTDAMLHKGADHIAGSYIAMCKPGIYAAGIVFCKVMGEKLIRFLVFGGIMLVAVKYSFNFCPQDSNPACRPASLSFPYWEEIGPR